MIPAVVEVVEYQGRELAVEVRTGEGGVHLHVRVGRRGRDRPAAGRRPVGGRAIDPATPVLIYASANDG